MSAKLVSFKKLPIQRRLTSNFEIMSKGKALIVDAASSDIVNGTTLELVIRKLDDEGKDGLIIYGPAYGPHSEPPPTASTTQRTKPPHRTLLYRHATNW